MRVSIRTSTSATAQSGMPQASTSSGNAKRETIGLPRKDDTRRHGKVIRRIAVVPARAHDRRILHLRAGLDQHVIDLVAAGLLELEPVERPDASFLRMA